MGEKFTRKTILWSLWILIVPAGLAVVYHFFPPSVADPWNLLAYVLFFVLMSFMPMNINGASTFLVQWVTVALFLKYGIFIEILVSQLSMLIVLYRSRTNEAQSLRIPFNSLMFFSVSLVAGLAYMAAGGKIGSLELFDVIAFGLIFQVVLVFSNQIIYQLYDYTTGNRSKFFSIDAVWDFALMLVIFPYAIALYMFEAYIGIAALVLLGVPFLTMTAVMKMYNNSEQINIDLKKAGVIGHQLASRLEVEEVLDQFVVQVAKMFKVEYAYVIDYRDELQQFLRIYENDQLESRKISPVSYTKGVAGKVIVTGESFIYNEKTDWEDLVTGNLPADTQSLMVTPIARNNKTEGVLVLASKKKYAFAKHQLQILEILSTYFAVSIEKAGYMQKIIAKSERCGLTKLYNYRYLDESLESCIKEMNKGRLDQLSLVMMDIDHFKSINDRYGHQSGNDILIQLADILREEIGDEGTIARYGGEEFVILLPDYSKELAMLLAENLRKRIEKHEFLIESDLAAERQQQTVHITMSIGVSTAPDDSDEGMALIRNADRALFIGAKQAGRNKVAAYVK
ncbi:diguanylate cyclase domain protein [Planococcus antarcticus DSM 14505]|uniref:Diguanylate cyclase domain protein n=1 Tax=Planococcus antarcticus DSM 14505 TaxID=1185653 RepID=A0AA87IJR7_9BACL|nr:sensor domain-containing diguanylate cyclase [Planococcus antarcticus]EIM05627.1 diguanylate cyclase domain protein [Planococcus antarcticus DSM 14505]